MANVAQRNFAGGEIAPALYARTDYAKYATGLRTCRNFIVQRHGGVANRPGLRWIGEVKDSSKRARLLPFIFDNDETYILELGDRYLRFYQDGGRVITAGVAAYSGVTAYVPGDLVTQGGVTYYNIQGVTGTAPPNAGFWYPLSGTTYEIPTPYLEADLAEIRFAQSADVITIVHPSYEPRQLKRFGHTRWLLELIAWGPAIQPVPFVNATGGTAVVPFRDYAVTAVDQNGDESTIAAFVAIPAVPSVATPIEITWTAVAGAIYYNVYAAPDGVTLGLIGTASGLLFTDTNILPDFTQTPPEPRFPFSAVDKYPRAVTYFQQRRWFGGTNLARETIWASRTGRHANFTVNFPIADDSALTFSLSGRRVNHVMHLLDLGRLIAFALSGEVLIEGDESGILRPAAINAREPSYAGSGRLPPLTVIDTALFVQARGSIVRDLSKALQDFQGSDLTIEAAHLFRGYQLADWDYQQNPDSVIWAARDDGVLVALTYVREHEIAGWHHHDTDGVFENVCVVPEGDEDAVYVVVRRTISGATKRYVERLESRAITELTDERDLFFVDAGLSYDGRNVGAVTMTLSGGVDWDEGEQITVTRSVAGFSAGDVGNGVFFYDAENELLVRVILEQFNSATVMLGRADRVVPVALRGVASTAWAFAVDELAGLGHLEGKAVSVLADGAVVASPNNADYGDPLVVAGGAIALGAPYAVIHVGLPYISDLETLDIDTASGPSIKERKINVTTVGLMLEKTRGLFAGPPDGPTDDDPLNDLDELKLREESDEYDAIALRTGYAEVNTQSNWDDHGRRFIRQVDPLPATILAAIPQGYIG